MGTSSTVINSPCHKLHNAASRLADLAADGQLKACRWMLPARLFELAESAMPLSGDLQRLILARAELWGDKPDMGVVRSKLATRADLDPSVAFTIEKLARETGNDALLATVLNNPATPIDLLQDAVASARLFGSSLYTSPRLSKDWWDSLGQDVLDKFPYDSQVVSLLSSPECPDRLLRRFASRTTSSRSAVAANRSAPPDLLELLATDDWFRVRRDVARGPSGEC